MPANPKNFTAKKKKKIVAIYFLLFVVLLVPLLLIPKTKLFAIPTALHIDAVYSNDNANNASWMDGFYVFRGALSDDNILKTKKGEKIKKKYAKADALKIKIDTAAGDVDKRQKLIGEYNDLGAEIAADYITLRKEMIEDIYANSKSKLPAIPENFADAMFQTGNMSIPFKYWVAMLINNPNIQSVSAKPSQGTPSSIWLNYKIVKQPSRDIVLELDKGDIFCVGIWVTHNNLVKDNDAANLLMQLVDIN